MFDRKRETNCLKEKKESLVEVAVFGIGFALSLSLLPNFMEARALVPKPYQYFVCQNAWPKYKSEKFCNLFKSYCTSVLVLESSNLVFCLLSQSPYLPIYKI